jgi:hypothetical protein
MSDEQKAECQHTNKITHPATRDIWECADCGRTSSRLFLNSDEQKGAVPEDIHIEQSLFVWQADKKASADRISALEHSIGENKAHIEWLEDNFRRLDSIIKQEGVSNCINPFEGLKIALGNLKSQIAEKDAEIERWKDKNEDDCDAIQEVAVKYEMQVVERDQTIAELRLSIEGERVRSRLMGMEDATSCYSPEAFDKIEAENQKLRELVRGYRAEHDICEFPILCELCMIADAMEKKEPRS